MMLSLLRPWARLAIFIILVLYRLVNAQAQVNFETTLPIVRVSTNGDIPDEPKIYGQLEIIWGGVGSINKPSDSALEYSGPIAIEKRGQTSQFLFPKNGYGFETKDSLGEDLDVSFLNFPEEEDWILHGPFSDKTLLRNDLAMHIGNEMGWYHSRTRHVELILNGDYHGVYLMMEKIKQDDNRVDIAKLKLEDNEGDELTGGYVFKVDKGDADWISRYQIQDREAYAAFQFVSPSRKKITNPQRDYLKSYVDSFERALYADNFRFAGKRYDEYADIHSFIDHFILKELAKDVDAYRISSYYYKDKDSKGGKLTAGPAWDFNIGFGNINYCSGDFISGWMYEFNCNEGVPFWWNRMLSDSKFKDLLKCRWEELYEDILKPENLLAYIDSKVAELATSVDRNYERWPILEEYVWPNSQVTGDYLEEIDFLKTFIETRLAWMDIAMKGFCEPSNNKELLDQASILVYPNPSYDQITIDLNKYVAGIDLHIYDTLGQLAKSRIGISGHKISLDVSDLVAGIYTLIVKDGTIDKVFRICIAE